jgi:hypothetical protein
LNVRQLHPFSLDEWRHDAACKGKPTEWWYPEAGSTQSVTTQLARSICTGCPVQEPCTAAGVARNEPGIWGGLGIKERRRIAHSVPEPTVRLVCKYCRTTFDAPRTGRLYCSELCATRTYDRNKRAI